MNMTHGEKVSGLNDGGESTFMMINRQRLDAALQSKHL